MRHRLRLLLPLFALSALACESPLSPGTEGPPVFAATVDHHPWPPADSPAVFTAILADSGTLTIAAAIKDANGLPVQLLGMSVPDFSGARRYPLSAGSGTPWALLRRTGQDGTAIFTSEGSAGGFIHITAIDTIAHIVAGTFSFSVRGTGSNAAMLQVTGGAFRMPYRITPQDDHDAPGIRSSSTITDLRLTPTPAVAYH